LEEAQDDSQDSDSSEFEDKNREMSSKEK